MKQSFFRHKKLLLLGFLLMYSLAGFQFYQRQSDYSNLSHRGIITEAKTTFIPKNYNADHFRTEFTTQDGKMISKTRKCGDERSFITKYRTLKVIYLIEKPEKYWELPDFKNYSKGFSIFFYFIVYGIVGSIVNYGFLIGIASILSKRFREEVLKNSA